MSTCADMATDGDAALTVKFIEAYVGGASSADADAEALIKNLNSGGTFFFIN